MSKLLKFTKLPEYNGEAEMNIWCSGINTQLDPKGTTSLTGLTEPLLKTASRK